MLGAFGEHEAPGGSRGHVAIGDAFARRTIGRHARDAITSVGEHGWLPGAIDDKQITRLGRRDAAAKHRQRRDRRYVVSPHGVLHDKIGRHRMADEADGAPHRAQTARENRDAVDLGEQRARARRHVPDAPRQGRGVASVPGEIERHRSVAGARQRHRHRLHQLLGAGETVGDHDNGSIALTRGP